MRRAPIAALLVITTACASQERMDSAAIKSAAAACGISEISFERLPVERNPKREESNSPFRRFGRWWVERRERQQHKVRTYKTDVPAIVGGTGQYEGDYTPKNAEHRRGYNRPFRCLAKRLEAADINIVPKPSAIVF